MNNLARLIGMAQAPLAAGQDQIDVNATRADPYALENGPNVMRRDFGLESSEAASDHRGMFGVKGTLRDVLGLVGDAFLIQSGNSPIYAPNRKQERLSDAMAGYTEDPTAAAERAMGIDPQAGMALIQQAMAQQKAEAEARNAEADNQRLAEKEGRNAYDEGAQLFGSYMGALNPETYAQGVPILQALKQRFGLGDEFQIPEQYDDDVRRLYQYGGMPTSRQISSAQADRRADQADARLDETRRSNRSRESIQRGSLNERRRSAQEREEDRDFSNDTARQRANSRGRGRSVPADRRQPGQMYRNGDSYEYVTSNGNVIPMNEAQARDFLQSRREQQGQ